MTTFYRLESPEGNVLGTFASHVTAEIILESRVKLYKIKKMSTLSPSVRELKERVTERK